MDILARIAEAVYNGEEEMISDLVKEVLENEVSPIEAIQKGGVIGLDRLGKDFEDLNVFLPEVMLGGEAMKELVKGLSPYLNSGESVIKGKVVIGAAEGDLHDIGKNLVATYLTVNGYDVADLGVDVKNADFINKAEEIGADIIAVSALMTTSAYYMEPLISTLDKKGLRDKYKIIVGGGPINPDYAKSTGADGYANTAFDAVLVCDQLMQGNEDDFIEIAG